MIRIDYLIDNILANITSATIDLDYHFIGKKEYLKCSK